MNEVRKNIPLDAETIKLLGALLDVAEARGKKELTQERAVEAAVTQIGKVLHGRNPDQAPAVTAICQGVLEALIGRLGADHPEIQTLRERAAKILDPYRVPPFAEELRRFDEAVAAAKLKMGSAGAAGGTLAHAVIGAARGIAVALLDEAPESAREGLAHALAWRIQELVRSLPTG